MRAARQSTARSVMRSRPEVTSALRFGRGGRHRALYTAAAMTNVLDGIGQVMSGAAYMTGTLEQRYRGAVAWVDCGTASLAAFGTLAALMERGKSGRGQKVEGALLRTALAFNNAALVEQ